ncbi:SRPBCC family protein [Micromonospora sp. WMMD882]|uniref:SRPBCC family protein n=1 Tax=Micromonospora sp. WMMD882 TaxID=3015151 RepID=UPI00248B845D|nr:SRPBCC family protein [Micromonospora sp. WMMD882]WBB77801.1 SRPBCC family protein [Micromonospora sp. WMMD882]
MGVRYRRTVQVAASAGTVARVMRDVAGWPRWNASVERLDRPGVGPLTVGETVRLKQRRLPANTWTVTDVDESGFTWTATSGGVRTTGDHRARAVDAGRTEAVLTLTLDGPLARLSALFAARLIRRYLDQEAEGLRREAEGLRPTAEEPAGELRREAEGETGR